MALIGNPPAYNLTALTGRVRDMLRDLTSTHISTANVGFWADNAVNDIILRLPRGLISNVVTSVVGSLPINGNSINLPADYLKTESLAFGTASSGEFQYEATRIFQEEESKYFEKTRYVNNNWIKNVYYYEYTASNSIPNTKTIVTVHGDSGDATADYKLTYIFKPLDYTVLGTQYEHLVFLYCVAKAYEYNGLVDLKNLSFLSYNRLIAMYNKLYAEQSFEEDRKPIKERAVTEAINVRR